MNHARPTPVRDEALSDLHSRIRSTRRIPNPWSGDASLGLPARDLDALLDAWLNEFDWRTQEMHIRSLPWATNSDGSLNFLHQPSAKPGAQAVLLLHGWPDSVLRFEKVLPLLGDISVVVPALPGYPFAPKMHNAMAADEMADLIASTMAELGYERYVVSGGDIGGIVAEILATEHPDRVSALHLTSVALLHAGSVDPSPLPADAIEYVGRIGKWLRTEGGFNAEQSTRPNTLIAALADSPAGLLAWIVEKLVDWADNRDGQVFSTDDLLTWVSVYWFSGTIGTSFSVYVEPSRFPDRVDVPTTISAFAGDILPAPRSFAEAFVTVSDVVDHANGGHFAAWEKPAEFVADLRRALAGGSKQVKP